MKSRGELLDIVVSVNLFSLSVSFEELLNLVGSREFVWDVVKLKSAEVSVKNTTGFSCHSCVIII